MTKTSNRETAQRIAAERGLIAGHCVFDGFYYVGTMEQLCRIGCLVL